MGAGLEGDVHSAVFQQALVLDGCHGVDLGVALAAAAVVALADDAALGVDDHSPHHGVGRGVAHAVACELEGAAHVALIYVHHSEL